MAMCRLRNGHLVKDRRTARSLNDGIRIDHPDSNREACRGIMNPLTPEHVQAIRKEIVSLPDDVSSEQIEQTAQRLERVCYEPFLIRQPPDFLRVTKDRLLTFIEELTADSDVEATAQEDLSLLLHQYRFLLRLRRDDPDAWDEISEVWEED